MKFFLKKELLWVPLLGIAWWALDFPFMKRYSREKLMKSPNYGARTSRPPSVPVKSLSIRLSRYSTSWKAHASPEKHAQQPSPYRHLLKPRAGGTGFVLGAMGTKLQTMLDVTIVYPDGVGGIWDYLSGRIRRVVVHIDQKTIPPVFLGCNYNEDREFRINFQKWVTALWEEKDQRIESLYARYS